MSSAPVTLLFTDLANASEVLQRAGDEPAQRLIRAHHALLERAAAAHGGSAAKWLGDGLMSTFASVSDALRCAAALQHAARGRVAGERLALRVGLHVGEAPRTEAEYFGTPVVIARGLCAHADVGQVVCSAVVPALLIGQHGDRAEGQGSPGSHGDAAEQGVSEDPAVLLGHHRQAGQPRVAVPQRVHQPRLGVGLEGRGQHRPDGVGVTRTFRAQHGT